MPIGLRTLMQRVARQTILEQRAATPLLLTPEQLKQMGRGVLNNIPSVMQQIAAGQKAVAAAEQTASQIFFSRAFNAIPLLPRVTSLALSATSFLWGPAITLGTPVLKTGLFCARLVPGFKYVEAVAILGAELTGMYSIYKGYSLLSGTASLISPLQKFLPSALNPVNYISQDMENAKSALKSHIVEPLKIEAQQLLNEAKAYLYEQAASIASHPFETLGWATAKTANFAAYTAPRSGYEFISNLDRNTCAFAVAYFGLIYLAAKRRPPTLAIEYHEATVFSRLKANGKKKLLEKYPTLLVAPNKKPKEDDFKAQSKHYLHTKAFEFFKKPRPFFGKKLNREVDAVRRSIENAKKNGGNFSNLLLEGPPGTGKTMVADYLASESGCNFIKMRGSDLVPFIEQGKGLHVKKLQELLAFGRNTSFPTIIFIDEMDSFTRKKSKLDQSRKDLLETFLNATGAPSSQLMIIGTTNYKGEMEGAALNRFGAVLKVGAPDSQTRAHILTQSVERAFKKGVLARESCLNRRGIKRLAAQTKGMVGRDIEQLVTRIHIAKGQTDSGMLTVDVMDETAQTFIEQKRNTPESSLASAMRVSNWFFDFWQFTTARWKRSLVRKMPIAGAVLGTF